MRHKITRRCSLALPRPGPSIFLTDLPPPPSLALILLTQNRSLKKLYEKTDELKAPTNVEKHRLCGSLDVFFAARAALQDLTILYGDRLIAEGIYMPCSQFEALFVSTAHTEEDIALTVEAAKKAMGVVSG